MTHQQLERANQIQKEIKELVEYRQKLESDNKKPEKYIELICPSFGGRVILAEFMPMSIETFINKVIDKTEEKIEKLTKEFENL